MHLSGVAHGRRIAIRGWWRQGCLERGIHRSEYTHSKTVEIADPGGVVLLALPFLAVSGIISGIVVATSPTKFEIVSKPFESVVDCSRPLTLTRALAALPSGQRLGVLTDPSGVAEFDIPENEGVAGTVNVSLVHGNAPPLTIPFADDADNSVTPTEGKPCEYVTALAAHRCPDNVICRDGRCLPAGE
jgi:hypothetical protein